MAERYNSILIPADVSISTRYAVERAVELADSGASIHLLFGYPSAKTLLPSFLFRNIQQPGLLEKFIDNCKRHIRRSAKQLSCRINFSSPGYAGIKLFACSHDPDIIIIGRKKASFLTFKKMSARKLARSTGAEVLSVSSGLSCGGIVTIIVPVNGFIPAEKIESLQHLGKKFRIKIIIVELPAGNRTQTNLTATVPIHYQWLSSSIGCHLEYHNIQKLSRMKKILQFAFPQAPTIFLVSAGPRKPRSTLIRDMEGIISGQAGMGVLTVNSVARI